MTQTALEAFNCNEDKYGWDGCPLSKHLVYDKDKFDVYVAALKKNVKITLEAFDCNEDRAGWDGCPLDAHLVYDKDKADAFLATLAKKAASRGKK